MDWKRTVLTLLITAFLISPADTFGRPGQGHTIEGTWEVTVDLQDPTLPPFFEALETYGRGGGLITSNNMPFLTRVGQGSWERIDNGYFVKIKFFKFDPSGLPSGSITVTHTITLTSNDRYVGFGAAVFRELDGSTVSVQFVTEGRRLSPES